eukprot:TRINITY_DN6906_c0_g1_i3.p1 TRINITY_DN6906_c0_g1~~TRINITY_DN6906_c0_g1_i3.p1  ORF type:complete len:128 (+),score=8.26 TRINITY_DN6906_c0_g1_i3:328-711(+)
MQVCFVQTKRNREVPDAVRENFNVAVASSRCSRTSVWVAVSRLLFELCKQKENQGALVASDHASHSMQMRRTEQAPPLMPSLCLHLALSQRTGSTRRVRVGAASEAQRRLLETLRSSRMIQAYARCA